MPTPEEQDKKLVLDIHSRGDCIRVAANASLVPFKRLEDLGWAKGARIKKVVLYTLTHAGVREAQKLREKRRWADV